MFGTNYRVDPETTMDNYRERLMVAEQTRVENAVLRATSPKSPFSNFQVYFRSFIAPQTETPRRPAARFSIPVWLARLLLSKS